MADLFQTYVRLVKQMDGWPLNVWLTPELKPFDGATYLPPSDEWGKEGFPKVATRILSAWQSDPDAQRRRADEAAGMALALSGVPPGLPGCLVALALFRTLDIGKPPPVSWCESVPGGPGVMLDDVVAGGIAAVLGAAAFALWPALAG